MYILLRRRRRLVRRKPLVVLARMTPRDSTPIREDVSRRASKTLMTPDLINRVGYDYLTGVNVRERESMARSRRMKGMDNARRLLARTGVEIECERVVQ